MKVGFSRESHKLGIATIDKLCSMYGIQYSRGKICEFVPESQSSVFSMLYKNVVVFCKKM